ncbi:N-formylglutamate amidohydrolase [Alkalimonas amylolytica]|uniref:N-formylglutamate deformylase n=1 Tax=Alkalimonas amylolytica TaxID=152573 RepID=A0A1H4CKN6_ALKAM|nr:N-formylglutamate amidohydrolase [Alkalimonas amylolytica]SEA60622.1 N-formylglutamate deformylase [Alkalimonas amylolytica]
MSAQSNFTIHPPSTPRPLPLVFDSPHSGFYLPADFAYQVKLDELKTGWDAYVDELWQPATQLGAYLLCAKASRMYIDLNRAPDDLDPALLAEPWPEPLQPTRYSERGMGLIRRFALPGKPVYASPLTVAAVQQRIRDYYQPYHQKLSELLSGLHHQFGRVWHIDCHSMKSRGNAMNIDADAARPDIVLGDADGSSSDPDFTACIQQSFQLLGYSVAVNHPYKGGHCVRAYGKPAQHYHSVQIEINRQLYMNEATFTKNHLFTGFQADLTRVSTSIAEFIQTKLR